MSCAWVNCRHSTALSWTFVYPKNSDVLCLSVLLAEYCCLLDFTVAPLSLFAKKYAIFVLSVLLAAYCHLLCPSEVKSRCYYSLFWCTVGTVLFIAWANVSRVLLCDTLWCRSSVDVSSSALQARWCNVFQCTHSTVLLYFVLDCTSSVVLSHAWVHWWHCNVNPGKIMPWLSALLAQHFQVVVGSVGTVLGCTPFIVYLVLESIVVRMYLYFLCLCSL